MADIRFGAFLARFTDIVFSLRLCVFARNFFC
jgi:hypothetical protein